MYNTHAISTLSWDPSNTAYLYNQKFYSGFCAPMFYLGGNNITTINLYYSVFQNNYAYNDGSGTLASIIDFQNQYNEAYTTINFQYVTIKSNYQVTGLNYFNLEGTYITFNNLDVENNGYVFTYLTTVYDSNYNYDVQYDPIFYVSLKVKDSNSYFNVKSSTFTNNTAYSTPLF